MGRRGLLLVAIAIFMLSATPVFAQNGCVNSPECPTAVLTLVGLAAAAALRSYRNR